MKPMPEADLLMLLGSNPTTDRMAEHLGDFLASHGFHDAARQARLKFNSVYDYDLDIGDPVSVDPSFQQRVHTWLMECFGAQISSDLVERNDRFIEEALELAQACGHTRDRAHALVDYVFSRPVGEKAQEVGGVMVTLAALCWANDLDLDAAAETELSRIWGKIEQIRAKQRAKPTGSALP